MCNLIATNHTYKVQNVALFYFKYVKHEQLVLKNDSIAYTFFQ